MLSKEQRIDIFNDTVKIVKEGSYISPNGSIIAIQNEREMVEGTKFYGKLAKVNFEEISNHDTNIEIENIDCLYAAEELVKQGFNPCVLNMASFHTPGGGVTRGSAAQEEDIFRRTNIFRSLFQFHNVGDLYQVPQREERYPLDANFGAVYSPYVTVFKSGRDNNYDTLDEPFVTAVISAAAIKNPPLKDGKLADWVKKTIKNKIRQILSVALENGHDSIVLGAFGCGAYKTPATEMARLFREILLSKDYNGKFDKIVFAILEDNNSFHEYL